MPNPYAMEMAQETAFMMRNAIQLHKNPGRDRNRVYSMIENEMRVWITQLDGTEKAELLAYMARLGLKTAGF